jgi:hypothetical protein
MGMFEQVGEEMWLRRFNKMLDELENIRKSEEYTKGNLYQQGLIDGAIIQIIKLKDCVDLC